MTGGEEGEYVQMVNGDVKLFLLTDAMTVWKILKNGPPPHKPWN